VLPVTIDNKAHFWQFYPGRVVFFLYDDAGQCLRGYALVKAGRPMEKVDCGLPKNLPPIAQAGPGGIFQETPTVFPLIIDNKLHIEASYPSKAALYLYDDKGQCLQEYLHGEAGQPMEKVACGPLKESAQVVQTGLQGMAPALPAIVPLVIDNKLYIEMYYSAKATLYLYDDKGQCLQGYLHGEAGQPMEKVSCVFLKESAQVVKTELRVMAPTVPAILPLAIDNKLYIEMYYSAKATLYLYDDKGQCLQGYLHGEEGQPMKKVACVPVAEEKAVKEKTVENKAAETKAGEKKAVEMKAVEKKAVEKK